MKMLAMLEKSFLRRIQNVISSVHGASFALNGESDREYASQFVDKIKEILIEHAEEGCVESDFAPHILRDEDELLAHTLRVMYSRNLIGREVRYFIREMK